MGADSIEVARSQQYTTNVQLLLQQTNTRFQMAVTTDTYVGKGGKVVEQVGETEAQERKTRHSDTDYVFPPQDAPWVFPTPIYWATLIDDIDKVQMLVDMTSPFAMAGAAAHNRKRDSVIIDAFFGNRKRGEDGEITQVFPASQILDVNIGGGSPQGLNIAKLRAAAKKFRAAELDFDNERMYLAISAEQHDNLLAETQATSLDYQTKPVLEEGRIVRFMGFDFVPSERLPTDSNGYRQNPAWAQSGMHLGLWKDFQGRIEELPGKHYNTQIYLDQNIGATRLEEKKVIQIPCNEG